MSGSGGPCGVTRRTVLAGAAAAGAASILSPAMGLAAGLDARRAASSRWVGTLDPGSRELAAPERFVLVGVEWAGPRAARIELRTRIRGGRWSDWVRGVRPHFVALAPAEMAPARAAVRGQALELAQPALDAGPWQPPIIARSAWGADHATPAVFPAFGAVRLAFVHHTENPNGYSAAEVPAMLLAMFQFHRFVRGWNDIGYNFVIDAFGRIWEGRKGGIDQAVIGAQAGGYNAVSTGVAILGSFTGAPPTRAALRARRSR